MDKKAKNRKQHNQNAAQKQQKLYEEQLQKIYDVEVSDDSSDNLIDSDPRNQENNRKIQQMLSEIMKQPQHKINTCLNYHQQSKRDANNGSTFNIQSISTGPIIHKIQTISSSTANNEMSKASRGGNNKREFKNLCDNNPFIYESTTTMHTTTKTTVKMNKSGNMMDRNIELNLADSFADKTELFKRLLETGQLSGLRSTFLEPSDILEDMDPKLGELIYSDQFPTNQKVIDQKSKWIQEAYGPIVEKSTHKTQLLQLIEYNKIAIRENDGYMEQKTVIEIIICKLMRQRLMNYELKSQIENHQFQGLETEQLSLIFSIVKLTKKSIHTLYKKCQNFTMTKEVNETRGNTVQQVYVKDLKLSKRDYMDMVRKMVDLYDEMIKKAQYFKTTTSKIFDTQPGFREIIQLMDELLKPELWQMIDYIEQLLIDSDYDEDDDDMNSEMDEILNYSAQPSDEDDIIEDEICGNRDFMDFDHGQFDKFGTKMMNSDPKSYAYDLSNFNNTTFHHYMPDPDESSTLSNQASTNETVQTDKKKKKRRKNKKKKKKKTEEELSIENAGNSLVGNEMKNSPNLQGNNQEDNQIEDDETIEVEDPEFEEDLKQFQLRLMLSNQNSISSNGHTPYRKLKPNVSNDWLIAVREKSKSLSDNFRTPQMTLVA
ncbi:UNKNOWN [Stylonychia lemnae]|uniref:Uncharacterized protein n=1 Tax=Stylonychia lemnae TaxID=5949 RepID=A0A078AN80_STYLE|nr:UNKNOWN [Stylonychia lemnae]|eukprot:CDW83624.1 UNKNOWN [Stylonychia lemnae]